MINLGNSSVHSFLFPHCTLWTNSIILFGYQFHKTKSLIMSTQSPSVIFVLFSLFLVSALDLCREILWFDSFTTTSLCANFIHREKHGGNWRSIAEEKYSNNEQIRITITIWNHDNDGGNGVNSTQIPCINVIWSEKWIKQLIEQPEFFLLFLACH